MMPAARASENPITRIGVADNTTMRTSPRCRYVSRNLDELAACPPLLVLDFAPQLVPANFAHHRPDGIARTRNLARFSLAPDQILYRELSHGDRLRARTNDPIGGVVK